MFKKLLDARYVSCRQRESERRELLKVMGKPGTDSRQVDRFGCEFADTATGLPAEILHFGTHSA